MSTLPLDLFILSIVIVLTSAIGTLLLTILASIGLEIRRQEFFIDEDGRSVVGDRSDYSDQGLKPRKSTYLAVVGYAALGLPVMIWRLLSFSGELARRFVCLIHSSERMLCGTASVIGGCITYLAAISGLGLTFTNPFAATLLIANGGLAGALVDYLDWQYVRPWLLAKIDSEGSALAT
jgi:hypothetical protein